MENAVDFKALRKRLGWSQREMSEYLGIDRTTVLRIERHGAPTSGPVMRLIALLAAAEKRQSVGLDSRDPVRFLDESGAEDIATQQETCAS